MAAAANNSSKNKYCKQTIKKDGKDITYDSRNLVVLLYEQYSSSRGKTILTSLSHEEIENPVKKITKSELQDLIKAINLFTCEGIVREDYIVNQLTVNKIYMILFDTSDKSALDTLPPSCKRFVSVLGKPVSFILGHNNDKDDDGNATKEAYIDIICACPGSGRYLLDYFINFAESNDYNAVSLSAIPTVLTYYPRFGFSHRHSCNPEESGIVPPAILSDKKYRDEKYKDIDNIYDDDEYYEYLKHLRDKEFGIITEDCSDPRISKQKLKAAKCGNNGYMMRKCKK